MIGDKQRVLSVYSPDFDAHSGYGRMTREIIRRAVQTGVYVNAIGAGNAREVVDRPIRPAAGGILLGYPTLYAGYGPLAAMGKRLAVTMFERDRLPAGWASALNMCDAVAVPTLQQAELFRQNGVKVPLYVIPLGVSANYGPRTAEGADNHPLRRYPLKRGMKRGQLWYRRITQKPSTGDPFIFMTWGDRGTRKGWDLALQAFNLAFSHRRDVRLVIKTRAGMPYEMLVPNVEVIRCDLDEQEMNDLYLRCDAMVFPSRGEGFGLPPREFVRTGGASIVTAWWADHVQRWAYPVRYGMERAWQQDADKRDKPLGNWAEADIDHLAAQMRHVVDQNPAVLCRQGLRSMEWVQTAYDWDKFGRQIIEAWEAL